MRQKQTILRMQKMAAKKNNHENEIPDIDPASEYGNVVGEKDDT